MPIHDLPPRHPRTSINKIDRLRRYQMGCAQCSAPMPIAWINVSDKHGAAVALCEGCILKLLSELAGALEVTE